mmetsp:Transcript_101744/g.242633  ORF Transcript_101744/g.242633 Transcript_101744/m.242633 type:complete len:356 (+) Transcript_101744:413-1480(+)
MDFRTCRAKANLKAGSSEAQRQSCTQVSCKYVVSDSLWMILAMASSECSSTSFLPRVSKEITFKAQMAASRTFASSCDRNCVIIAAPPASSVSTRPCAQFPQCQSSRRACRKISLESSASSFGMGLSMGTFPRNFTTLPMSPKPVLKMSRMPSLAYIVTAAIVCRSRSRQSARGRVAGKSGSVPHMYWVMPRTVPWSTTCWQPSRKMVMACKASATCSFTNSSSQLSRSFASLGTAGPAAICAVNLSASGLFPRGNRPRPPMRRAMLLMTRAASRRTGTDSCSSKCVAAAMTSQEIATVLLSWWEQRSQMVRSASTSVSGAMPGDESCSMSRGKSRSPCAMLTSSTFKWPRMSSR